MRIIFTIFFFFLNYLFPHLIAQVKVHKIGIDQGLPNNSVTTIYQDTDGFMWFGTVDGLSKYDGYTFKSYRNLSHDSAYTIDNRISAISEISRGNFLVGTKRGGVIFNPDQGNLRPLSYQEAKGGEKKTINSQILSICEGKGGISYFSTSEEGVFAINGEGKMIQLPVRNGSKLIYDTFVQALCKDNQGRIWVSIFEVGLAVYQEEAKEFLVINREVKNVKAMACTDQSFWVALAANRFVRYDIVSNKIFHEPVLEQAFEHTEVYNLQAVDNDHLLVCTDGDGLAIVNIKSYKIDVLKEGDSIFNLSSASVTSAFDNGKGLLWVATLRGGINLVAMKETIFKSYTKKNPMYAKLPHDFIMSFCEENADNVWIGTDGYGLSLWNKERNTFENFQYDRGNLQSISNNYITTLRKDYKGALWVGTYGGGINRFDPKKKAFVRYDCRNEWGYHNLYVWKLFEDRHQNLWAGTLSGGSLYRLNRKTDRFEVFDNALKNILTLAQDGKGNLWGADYGNLIRIDTLKKQHQYVSMDYCVRAIEPEGEDQLWLGTEGDGLYLYDIKTGSITKFTEADGLPNNSILNIVRTENGKLWLTTFRGIAEFDIKSKRTKVYFESDGLPSNQFNYNAALKLSDGQLLTGTISGFCSFNPYNLHNDIEKPKITITSILVNNAPIQKHTGTIPTEIVMPYDKAVLSIEYTALAYGQQEKIKYAYYLEGLEKDWHYVDDYRKAIYGKLPPGKYKLHIRCTNTDGEWSDREKMLDIEILPPWWMTWWAYVGYGLVVMGMIFLYNRYKSHNLKLQNEVLLAQMKLEQEKELQEKKAAFLSHVSHELRSPLTLILNPVKEMLDHDKIRKESLFSEKLNVVYRNSKRLLSLVDQLLLLKRNDSYKEELRVIKGNLVEVCQEVFLCYEHQASVQCMDYRFVGDPELGDVYFDREKIEIALANLLSNAFKYTPKGGCISLKVFEEGNNVLIRVKDSGCGVSEDIVEHLFDQFVRDRNIQHAGFGIGLYLAKTYVEKHGGTLVYGDGIDKGAVFTISLLKGKSHLGSIYVHEYAEGKSRFLEELVLDVDKPLVDLDRPKSFSLLEKRETMLIVDDQEEIRTYLCGLFEEDFAIIEAASAEDALEILEHNRVGIILSDVMMGEISGITFCKKVKEKGSIPVLLLTASISEENKLKGIQYGADDYLQKPFDRDILLAKVSNLMRNRQQAKESVLEDTVQMEDRGLTKEESDFIEACELLIVAHVQKQDFNVQFLADKMTLSYSAFYKKIKCITGRSINDFIRIVKLKQAAKLLLTTDYTINEAAFAAGFNDVKYFRGHFQKYYGVLPSEYTKKYRSKFAKKAQIKDI